MKLRKLVIVSVVTILSGCGFNETKEFESAQASVREKLADPESAQFRNESIRTLWSKDGARMTIYCGEVNARNAFGGKVGYRPVWQIIDQKVPEGERPPVIDSGFVAIEQFESADYYLNCLRRDTERATKDMFLATPDLWSSREAMRKEMDQQIPVLS